jgi:hypothetical protein
VADERESVVFTALELEGSSFVRIVYVLVVQATRKVSSSIIDPREEESSSSRENIDFQNLAGNPGK